MIEVGEGGVHELAIFHVMIHGSTGSPCPTFKYRMIFKKTYEKSALCHKPAIPVFSQKRLLKTTSIAAFVKNTCVRIVHNFWMRITFRL